MWWFEVSSIFQKGQFFGTDFVFATSLFLFMLSILLVTGNQVSVRVESVQNEHEMRFGAFHAFQALTLSPGSPSHWNTFSSPLDVNALGLAIRSGVLDEAKIQRLADWNASYYIELKAVLGIPRYDFYLHVKDENLNVVSAVGALPDVNKTRVVLFRPVMVGSHKRWLELGVFK